MNNINWSDQRAGGIGGCILSVSVYLAKIDWTSWLQQTSEQVLTVAVTGLIGGAMGVLGQLLIKRVFKIKK